MNARSLSPFLISLALLGTSPGFISDLDGAVPAGAAQVGGVEIPVVYPLSKDVLIPELSRALISQFNVEGELQIELLTGLPRVAPSSGPWQVQVIEFPSAMASIMQVRLRVTGQGRDAVDVPVNLRAQVWREVWATREPIAKDSPFDPSILELRKVDVMRERNGVPSGAADGTMMFRTQVAAGRLIQWRDIERRALVRKGDMIDVVASDGMLTVKMKALALQNGASGEMITVRNMQSKRDISALVVGENQAQVRF